MLISPAKSLNFVSIFPPKKTQNFLFYGRGKGNTTKEKTPAELSKLMKFLKTWELELGKESKFQNLIE